jgi:hypothetical protein
MLLFLQVMSTLLVNQAWQLWGTSYTEWQRFVTIAVLVANAAFGMFALQRCCDLFSGAVCSEKKAPRLYGLYVLMSCFAVYRTFGLALDGRYLSFPSVQLSVIIAATLGLVLIRYSTAPRWSGNCLALNSLVGHVHDNVRQDNLLAYVMLLGGAALVVGETYAFVVAHDLITDYPDFTERLRRSLLFAITNRQLVEWLVVLGILAIPLLNNIRYDNEDMQRNLH